jgi:mono/diheme cytochrome c family protein
VFVLLAAMPVAGAAQLADTERGRALYENHCQVCHTPGIHSRVNRLAITRAEVRDIVENWQKQQALRWNDQEVGDVVEFLNQTRYRFR